MAYLSRASLGQVVDDVDLLRGGEGSDDLADLERELLDERTTVGRIVLELTTFPDLSELNVEKDWGRLTA